MKVAVVGCTGLVGSMMLKVLEERNFPVDELIPVASEKSVGKTINFKGKSYTILSIEDSLLQKPDIALFSAGGSTSLENAPKYAAIGTIVIDNSSAWRMDPDKKLVIPEVNMNVVTPQDKIIANPNCSTIQMVVALKPLHDRYRIKRVVVSTYQSVTGTGVKAVQQLLNERKGTEGDMAYHYKIDMNAIPQCDVFTENGYTKEEMKLINETRKIIGEPHFELTSTTVRIPVVGGHSESVNIEFENEIDIDEIKKILSESPGIQVQDDIANHVYPMPIHSHNKDEVFVGRIRRDHSVSNGLNLWIVSDNLRKGAATNAIQIAESLIARGFIQN